MCIFFLQEISIERFFKLKKGTEKNKAIKKDIRRRKIIVLNKVPSIFYKKLKNTTLNYTRGPGCAGPIWMICWLILDHIGTIWTKLDILSVWTSLFWPVYFELCIWTCLFGPVYLDTSIWTCLFGPVYLDSYIWTRLFGSVYLDPFIGTRIFGPVYLDLSI